MLLKPLQPFLENRNDSFLLMWITLNFNGESKIEKKRSEDTFKGTLDIEFERDWSVGLGATLGDAHTEFYFPVSGIFPGKADSVILLC